MRKVATEFLTTGEVMYQTYYYWKKRIELVDKDATNINISEVEYEEWGESRVIPIN